MVIKKVSFKRLCGRYHVVAKTKTRDENRGNFPVKGES